MVVGYKSVLYVSNILEFLLWSLMIQKYAQLQKYVQFSVI